MSDAAKSLTVRRVIRASPQALFDAWTRPDRLVRWWGPDGVTCPHAEMDLRAGGPYRIANVFPSGETIWISGCFEAVEPPRLLVFSWRVEGHDGPDERVTVQFLPLNGEDGTEVVVRHERIASVEILKSHDAGWAGCLDGLERFIARGDAVEDN